MQLGQVVIMATLTRHEVDRLVCAGYLAAAVRHDPDAIAHAVERMIERWAGVRP